MHALISRRKSLLRLKQYASRARRPSLASRGPRAIDRHQSDADDHLRACSTLYILSPSKPLCSRAHAYCQSTGVEYSTVPTPVARSTVSTTLAAHLVCKLRLPRPAGHQRKVLNLRILRLMAP